MMKRFQPLTCLFLINFILIWTGHAFGGSRTAPDGNTDATNHQIRKNISSLQIPFIANKGQVDKEISFYAKTFGGTFYVTRKGKMVYSIPLPEGKQDNSTKKEMPKGEEPRGWVLTEYVVGSTALDPRGTDKAEPRVNYFKGRNRDRWKSNLPSYKEVNLGKIYRGITLKLRAYGNNVEKIFTIKPGSSPETIKVAMEGAQSLDINKAGELEVTTGLGKVKFTKPIAYQEKEGKRDHVTVAYRLDKEGYGFDVGEYDGKRPLIIDPLVSSTFIGGSGDDYNARIRRDSSGNIYLIGVTSSTDFPVISGAYDTTYNGSEDVFISKLSSDQSTLLASTFIGGSGDDSAFSAEMDSSGNIYVTGMTDSTDYPTTAGAYDTNLSGVSDVFISKVSPDLSTLLASTFIGGSWGDRATAIELDSSGNVYVAGITGSTDYPTTTGAYNETFNGGSEDIFVSKLSPDLNSLVASTFIGGNDQDQTYHKSLPMDGSGNLYLAGYTWSTDYPTTPGAYASTHNGGGPDNFISKLSPDLKSLVASTFIGGSGIDLFGHVTLDGSGNIYMTGRTDSSDYPTTAGAFDTTYNGGGDISLSKLTDDLSTLLASTFIGGSSEDRGAVATLDSNGDVYLSGMTYSSDYPTTTGAFDVTYNGGRDICVSKLDSNLTTLLASTFIGGSNDDFGGGGHPPDPGFFVLGGRTDSGDFPIKAGAYDTTHNGGLDVRFSVLTDDLSGGLPDTPTAISPADDAILGPVSGISLITSAFSGLDGHSHVRTHWKVRRADSVWFRSDYPASFDFVTTSGLTTHTVSGLAIGMEYAWKVGYVDSGSGITSWSMEYYFKVGTSQADSSVRIPPGTTVADFKMASFVQWPDNPNITSVLGNEVGGSYDRRNFRIGAYDPTIGSGGYQEYGSGHEIGPGEAGWILAKNGMDITVNGIPVSTSLDIDVKLFYNTGNGNGWNQIGAPNNADYFWGNVKVVEYDSNGNILSGPTPISSLSDPNSFIDKKLWRWSNGSYYSDTTWVRKYEGYWVKVKKPNIYLQFPVSAQAKLSNPGTMLAAFLSEGKRLIKKYGFLTPDQAIADAGDSPPGPLGDLRSGSAGGSSSGGGGGGSYTPSGSNGGGAGGGAGCFISTLLDQGKPGY